MTEVKIFKIEQKFGGTEDLYKHLLKNVKLIGEVIGIQIQKPIKAKPFCIVGREKITERNVLFFASKSGFTGNLGELITLASVFEADIIVFFIKDAHKNYLGCVNWLQSISNEDTQFIVGEVSF
jgi:hypothetical protein